MRRLVKVFFVMGIIMASLGGGIAQAGMAAIAAADTLKSGLTVEGNTGVVQVQAGDTLTVRIEIMEQGPAFNAFDAYVRFDPAVLAFLPPTFLRDQEGPLMLEACPQTFHLFYQSPDSMTLEIHHSLLCAGVSVTGPGVVYQLRFRCRNVDAFTHLDLLAGPDEITRFFMDGVVVNPLVRSSLFVQVGAGASAVPEPLTDEVQLRASPNPFNPRTEFFFDLPQAELVEFAVYNLRGLRVRNLLEATLAAGPHQVPWNGRDDSGRRVESGVYFGLLTSPSGQARTKVLVLQ